MLGFSGWSFLTNANGILNTQGVNMLINVFFGVTVNASRGISSQVESAVLQFVNNFTMAVNPQIIKSYATGDMQGLYTLVCRGLNSLILPCSSWCYLWYARHHTC